MAKYTEQFGEWLKNHSLPDIFNEIENLKDLFILKYIFIIYINALTRLPSFFISDHL